MRQLLTIALCAVFAASLPVHAAEQISIRGSLAGAEAVTAAAAQIKKDIGLEFRVVTEGGNSTAIAGMADDVVDVAVTNRALTPRERATWPARNFVETRMGMQALVVVVPDQVWTSGVHALTKEQLRDIYEGKTTNWKALGGHDEPLVFYSRPVSRSVWELTMAFLYEDTRKAPLTEAEVVAEAGDVAISVEFNGRSISVMEYGSFTGGRLHALGIKLADGSVVEPTSANIASGRYPIARPLMMITARKPAGNVRKFVEFMLGPKGQEFVKKTGHVPNAELVEDKP
jgi:phosphate transport system substrate-binding protein